MLKKILGITTYTVVLVGITSATFLYLLDNGIRGAFDGLVVKTLTFVSCFILMVAMEMFYDWRYKINLGRAFNLIEGNADAAARYLGHRFIGTAIIGAAIYGAIG